MQTEAGCPVGFRFAVALHDVRQRNPELGRRTAQNVAGCLRVSVPDALSVASTNNNCYGWASQARTHSCIHTCIRTHRIQAEAHEIRAATAHSNQRVHEGHICPCQQHTGGAGWVRTLRGDYHR